jgi:hypothetical protein
MIVGRIFPAETASDAMDDRPNSSADSARSDVTLDVDRSSPVLHESTAASSPGQGRCVGVAMVEGTAVGLSGETVPLLRWRLRLAALLMLLGLVIFLPLHYVQADFGQSGSVFLFGFHCVVAVVFGVVATRLCQRCQISLMHLRAAELVVFGLATLFFMAMEYFVVLEQSAQLLQMKEILDCDRVHIALPGGTWLLLIFTYALFIPNTWRRAAIVLGTIAAMPIVMLVGMMLALPQVREVVGWRELTSFPLMLLVAAVTGLFGVDTIGSLRRAAFEARQLGQYRLKRRIGSGGMGEVFLAEHQLLKRPCVVKLIRPDRAGDAKVLVRFQREVQATAKLTHWNTIDIFDYGVTEDGTFYYVMEYLKGMSLAELVERFGPMPPERVIYLLRQACDALREAHAAGLVHRDIKPANIFAAKRGGVYDVAKLLDFGLVKPVMNQEASVHLTSEGSITGSPLFMSPEQATGDGNVDVRSDIYSLGAVAYFLLASRPPFEGDRPIQVMIAHVRDEVLPPSKHRSEIPADLEQVVLRCLSKRPEDRYQSAANLAEALDQCESAGGWNRARAAQWWQDQEQVVTV